MPPLVSDDSTVESGGQSCQTAAEPCGVGGRGPQRKEDVFTKGRKMATRAGQTESKK